MEGDFHSRGDQFLLTIKVFLILWKKIPTSTFSTYIQIHGASQVALVVKNPSANAGDKRDVTLTPVSGRSPGRGHGNPLQYSCLENPMDRGAWGLKELDTIEATWQTYTQLSSISFFFFSKEKYPCSRDPSSSDGLMPSFFHISVQSYLFIN